jgi:hypothetical protein
MTYSIAKTIRDQITTIDKMALWAWGAKNLIALENGLRFKSSGMTTWKGRDLYDVEFGRIRKYEYKTVKTVNDVYVEDLVHVIDMQVG